MVKIALVGYARSGKNVVGEMIRDYLKTNGHGHTVLMAFGDVLKERFHDAFPDVPEDPKPREGYEKFGKLGRDIDPDMWVKELEKDLKLEELAYNNFVITDLRQPNESKWAKENGFILISLWAYPEDRKERSHADREFQAVNVSEALLHEIKCDYTIYNIGTLDDLKGQVIEILKEEIDKWNLEKNS